MLLMMGQEGMRAPVGLLHCCRVGKPMMTSSQQVCWYLPKSMKGWGELHEQNIMQGEAMVWRYHIYLGTTESGSNLDS
jgi:hypothetical protein